MVIQFAVVKIIDIFDVLVVGFISPALFFCSRSLIDYQIEHVKMHFAEQ